jgi:predicted dehydrogenase
VKFLIAGLGSIGRRHLRNLLSLGEQDIVLFRTGKSTLPPEEIESFPSEHTLEAALDHQPDAVIVSNPTSLHHEVAVSAARLGCHLLIEKPIAHTLHAAGQILEAVQLGGSRVLVGYQFRFHPGLQAVKDWLDAGEIGQPYYVRAHWGEYLPDWHPWESFKQSYAARRELGGGVVLTLSHPLDYLRWLFGQVALRWSSTASSSDWKLGVEDVADAMLTCGDQVLGQLHLDYLQRPPAHSVDILGREGSIRWDGLSGVPRRFNPDRGTWQAPSLPQDFERNSLFLDEMQHFIEIVRDGVVPRCTLEDGLEALKLALAIREFNPADGRLS